MALRAPGYNMRDERLRPHRLSPDAAGVSPLVETFSIYQGFIRRLAEALAGEACQCGRMDF
jgi:hypothetical protein